MARQRKRKRPRAAAPASPPARPATRSKPNYDAALAVAYCVLAAAVFAAYPEPAKWALFATTVALGLLHAAWRLYRGAALAVDLADALLALLIALAALSLIWSANLNGGIQTVIIASACLAFAVCLKNFGTQTIFAGIAVGVAMGDLLALAWNLDMGREQWSGFGNRGYAAEAFTLSIPFMWPLWRSPQRILRALAVVVAVADAGYVALFTPSMIEAFVATAFLAIGSIVLCFRRARWLGWAVVAAWILIPPATAWVGWDALKLTDRLLIRTELWVNGGFMIADRPLLGHGAGSFIEVYPLYKEAHGDLMPFVNTAFESYVTEAEALHNDPLQLIIELGIVSVFPFMALVATLIRAAARRFAIDPIAAAGGAAIITILTESLIEYPFQRGTTLFLASIALAMAMHGQPAGRARRTMQPVRAVRLAALPLALAVAIVLIFASYRQYEAERRLDAARTPGIDPVQGFQILDDAYRLDPLERRVRTALPVLLDGVVRARGANAVPKATIEEVFRATDNGGHFNTSALVARAQILLELDHGDDAEFPRLLKDLERGSTRVAAVYAIEARYHLIHERFLAALNAIAEGQKYTEGVSAIPSADAAIKTNLDDIERAAKAGIELQKQLRLQFERQTEPGKQP